MPVSQSGTTTTPLVEETGSPTAFATLFDTSTDSPSSFGTLFDTSTDSPTTPVL
jgi:hypothetical protein